jgi:hypothetical protein
VWGRATIRRRERSRDVRRTNLRISVAGSAVSLPLSPAGETEVSIG